MSDRVRESTGTRKNKPETPVQRKTADKVAANTSMGAEPVGVLLQRAQLAPGTLSAGDSKRLQGALGNQSPVVQPKLIVGAANDPFEQEADRVANHVMQNSSSGAQGDGAQVDGNAGSAFSIGAPSISRMTASSAQRAELGGEAGGAFEAGDGLQQQLSATRGGGSPLPNELRRKFEPAFGADFGAVRVHTGGDSAQMSNAIQAKAFTNGSDIHFNQGVYDPHSSAGQRLLAHELTHVVQQGAATQSPVAQRKPQDGATFAVQRTPFGMIQRTNQKVSSLVAFWEKQKELNAPKKPEGKGTPPAPPPPQQQVATPVGGGGGGTGFGAPSPVGGGGSGGGGGSVFDKGSTQPGGGGGVLVTGQGGGSTGVGKSDSTHLGSKAPVVVAPPKKTPKGVQFPDTAKYHGDRLHVHSEYDNEENDSTIFVMTKVFGVASEADFFSRFDEARRKKALTSIGWSPSDIAELEATHKSKVHYVNDEAERAEYVLNLGPTMTQGTATAPYDTKDNFANGVGQGHSIFVMDLNGVFYAGRHKIGVFHHSSFLGGGDAASAGTLKVTGGKLVQVTAKSGHYAPGEKSIKLALMELKARGVSLSGVTLRTLNPTTFAMNPEQDAEAFIAPPKVPTPSSSPISTSGAATPVEDWKQSEADQLYCAGGNQWEDTLKSMGLKHAGGKKWSFKNFVLHLSNLIDILDGTKKPDDFVSA